MTHNYYIGYSEFNKNIGLNDFELKQIGRAYCNENTLCENHYHGFWYELTIVTDGVGEIFTNNKPVTVKKGDIYLSCPYDIHRIETDKTDLLKYDFFSFIPKDKGLIEKLNAIMLNNSSVESRVIKDDRISYLVSNAIREVSSFDEELSPLVVNGIFWQVAIYLIRDFEKKATLKDVSAIEREVLCFQIMDYINNELYNINNLSDLSKVFKYSYNHLSSIFKKTTSIAIIEYYNTLRLDTAKALIEEGLNLTQIAEKLNYATPYSLSKAFKNHFKISPRQYKNTFNKN